MDAGTINSLADFRRVCSPKILLFDLRTNNLVRSIVFPEDVLRPHSVLTNLVVDETLQGKCDAAFVYISDSVAAGKDILLITFRCLLLFNLNNTILCSEQD